MLMQCIGRIFCVVVTGGGDGERDRGIFWRCEVNSVLKEKLLIRVNNLAKQRAVALSRQLVLYSIVWISFTLSTV